MTLLAANRYGRKKGCPKAAQKSDLPFTIRSRENLEGRWTLFQSVRRPMLIILV
jgi:hypothetical protein